MGGNEDGRGLGERLAIDPARRATLLFGSRHDGLWRSDDAGRVWRKAAGFPLPGLGAPAPRTTHGGLSFVLFDPTHPGRVFVGAADPGSRHLFRSDDGGTRWNPVAGGPEPDLCPVKAVVGGDGVLTLTYSDGIGPNGITRGAVWRHDPATGAWRDVTPGRGGPPAEGGFMGVAVSRQDPHVIAVSTVDRYHPVDTVWRSTDAGAHWDELYRRSTRDTAATPFLTFDKPEADFGHWIAGLAIDPFDPAHAAYVTGATLYDTRAFDRPGAMRWQPWTRGIEQTAIITLVSPQAGAPLVSGFRDIGGFRHDDLARSPAAMHRNPFLSNTNTLDSAGAVPAIMVRSGSTHTRLAPGPTLAWSADGGRNWRPLDTGQAGRRAGDDPAPPERTGDAAIAVSADGAVFAVSTVLPVRTTDRGATWQRVAGLPGRIRVTADRVDPRRFYAIDPDAGRVLRSDDAGASYRPAAGRGLPADLSAARSRSREAQNPLVATPDRAGALWLLLGDALYRSTDGGDSWSRTGSGVAIRLYGLGRAAPGSGWPTLFAVARRGDIDGLWRSIDGGARWTRINDAAHQWGMRFRVISGDPKTYGRVYLGTDGRGILYGDPAG
jgi:hypothetical protein